MIKRLFFLSLLCFLSADQANVLGSDYEKARIIREIAGDIVEAWIGGKIEKLQLIGVECGWPEPIAEVERLLVGKTVYLEKDSTLGQRDRYGRLLVYVWVDGLHYNLHMVQAGFARKRTYKKPYKYQFEFRQAENQARVEKRGLWGECYFLEENLLDREDRGHFFIEYMIVDRYFKGGDGCSYELEFIQENREKSIKLLRNFWIKKCDKACELETEKAIEEAIALYPEKAKTAKEQRLKYIFKELIPCTQSYIFDNWDQINETILNTHKYLKKEIEAFNIAIRGYSIPTATWDEVYKQQAVQPPKPVTSPIKKEPKK